MPADLRAMSGQSNPEEEEPSIILEKAHAGAVGRARGRLESWEPESLRHSPSLGSMSAAEAAQRDPGFYMPSAACTCPRVLCSLNLFLWWLFLSQCCSLGKEESRELGLTAEGWPVTPYMPTERYEYLGASIPAQRLICTQGRVPLRGETLAVQPTDSVKEP